VIPKLEQVDTADEVEAVVVAVVAPHAVAARSRTAVATEAASARAGARRRANSGTSCQRSSVAVDARADAGRFGPSSETIAILPRAT
jgi:hypothetical protein